jgi:hypothetical protein
MFKHIGLIIGLLFLTVFNTNTLAANIFKNPRFIDVISKSFLGRQMISLSSAVRRPPSKITQGSYHACFVGPTNPIALERLLQDPEIVEDFLSATFSLPSFNIHDRTQWRPYVTNSRNAFLEFTNPNSKNSAIAIALEVTREDLWKEALSSKKAFASDTGLPTVVCNIVTEETSLKSHTAVLPLSEDPSQSCITHVHQLSLASIKLDETLNPLTHDWLELLVHAQKISRIPAHVVPSLKKAYGLLDLSVWPPELLQEYNSNTFSDERHSLSNDDWQILKTIVAHAQSKNYPLSTIVKYTGLSAAEIKKLAKDLQIYTPQ